MVGIRSDLRLSIGRIAPASVTITSPDGKPSSSVRNSCVLCDVFATTGNTVRFPCRIGERTLYPEYEFSPACTCLLPANAIPNTNPHSISPTNNLVIMLSSGVQRHPKCGDANGLSLGASQVPVLFYRRNVAGLL